MTNFDREDFFRSIRVKWIFMDVFTIAAPGDGPYGITTGPDGALWCTLVHAGAVMRIALDGTTTRFNVRDGGGPALITPDLWFSLLHTGAVGRISPSGEVSLVPLPGVQGSYGVASGPDGGCTYTTMQPPHIGFIGNDGSVATVSLPEGSMPSMVTVAGGSTWCTLNQAGALAQVGPSGALTIHPLPTPDAGPVGIATGGDGAVWFTEIAAGQIGRITADGTITEFPLPDRAGRPHAITADPAGGCWFTEWAGNRIGHITAAGAVTTYDLPVAGAEPHGITVAPDGTVWTALETGAVARLTRT
ncbi:virginiamycin B lyase family protein [Dactylosporangium sp. CA-152071]|uniref:Vgb family protein n=1 Tax=Dactylosporangium sp. CA-152071 TaxID=3239933 RepID=UPI003D949CCB